MSDIFDIETDKPLVAVRGKRNGYLMLAPSRDIRDFRSLPPEIFIAAQAWAAVLEDMGAARVYWITLSEVNRHLHIHLFPRWPGDVLTGIPLFETREDEEQPAWTQAVTSALQQWAKTHRVALP